jgi:hypothetical protein
MIVGSELHGQMSQPITFRKTSDDVYILSALVRINQEFSSRH